MAKTQEGKPKNRNSHLKATRKVKPQAKTNKGETTKAVREER